MQADEFWPFEKWEVILDAGFSILELIECCKHADKLSECK